MFITKLWSDPVYFICWTVMVVFSVCCHELAHVYAALNEGDDTAARRGYLTLDPMKLMGTQSLLALAFLGIAWGAVPVTISKFRNRYSHALVAAAGPSTNLLLGVVFAFAAAFAMAHAQGAETVGMFGTLFKTGLKVNCMLALLNILPIPMFDGWEVAAYIAPSLNRIPAEKRYVGGWIALMVLFITPLSRVLWGGAAHLAGVLLGTATSLISWVGPGNGL